MRPNFTRVREVVDGRSGYSQTDFVGPLHRAINLIIALILVALGCGGVVYFYFITTTLNHGLAVASGVVAGAGLYWLWDEHINAGPKSWD